MKIVKSVLITLTLLIVLPIVVLIVYYQFDEKLDPKAATWGEPRFLMRTDKPQFSSGACYPNLAAVGDELHIVVSHHFRALFHARMKVADLEALPRVAA